MTLVFQYDQKIKCPRLQWKNTESSRVKKFENTVSKSKAKTILICLPHIKGITHYKCVSPKQAVNQAFYF
jgi:hypothetical protein